MSGSPDRCPPRRYSRARFETPRHSARRPTRATNRTKWPCPAPDPAPPRARHRRQSRSAAGGAAPASRAQAGPPARSPAHTWHIPRAIARPPARHPSPPVHPAPHRAGWRQSFGAGRQTGWRPPRWSRHSRRKVHDRSVFPPVPPPAVAALWPWSAPCGTPAALPRASALRKTGVIATSRRRLPPIPLRRGGAWI